MHSRRHNLRTGGFTFLEIVLVLVILGIIAALGADVISGTEANLRADRAARETLAALRFARNLATTTGNVSGVEFDTVTKKIRVFTMVNSVKVPVSVPFAGSNKGGTYLIDFATDHEVAGVSMSVSIPTDVTNPHDVTFNPLGATKNTGSVMFAFGNTRRKLNIAALSDPTID